ncbi:receptor kinase-like protein Xa21 [Gossypium arboreum]|uniref:receptor kinase-like protein Xa21 n=1 Tax=Gossypium arboreum TaxID=29729 RepID=UPI0022F1CA31|nr:receptor kinase-like protein Xa21 [Gossypium arboreum]
MIEAPKLNVLSLHRNKLRGNIPNSILNASMLKLLDLGDNFFSGPIPETFGNLRHLEWFRIANNYLTMGSTINNEWTFLSSLTNCKNLTRVDISENPLNGTLPTNIGNLSASLIYFYAIDCELKGNIPMEIGNLSNLLLLQLDHNKLSGFIPTSIGGMRNLQGLDLSFNKLGGPILESLCGLERLYDMSLGLNKLHGSIPSCFGNITSLRYLYLNSNKLSSAIPSTLWKLKDILEVDLSSNYLNNSHALDVGDLKSLLKLNLSRNLFTGDILSTFGGLQTLVFLDLSNNILHGHIPESFGGLISLTFLDLCNNNLSGVIPKSLEKLLYLKYFNVSLNRLEGEIPTKGCFSNFPSTSFMQNYALCGPPRLLVPPCKNDIRKNSKMGVLHDLRISHAELSRATSGFDEHNMLGSGSFGYVYKGRLSDGMEVAIKVFNLQIEGAFRSFDIECEAMRNIVHRNLVKVITCCSNVDFKALVLGFMSNGNLEKWLHSNSCFLDIIQRINIMVDVAAALEYLHSGHPTPIIHCDLKPSNILLDEDMVAHVGDFGIAKLLGEGDVVKQTMTLATIGYMAPGEFWSFFNDYFSCMSIYSNKHIRNNSGLLMLEMQNLDQRELFL